MRWKKDEIWRRHEKFITENLPVQNRVKNNAQKNEK